MLLSQSVNRMLHGVHGWRGCDVITGRVEFAVLLIRVIVQRDCSTCQRHLVQRERVILFLVAFEEVFVGIGPFGEEAWRSAVDVPGGQEDFICHNVCDSVFFWDKFV